MSTTEVETPVPATKVTLDLEFLADQGKRIASLDEQISVASGSETAIRNSVLAKMATDNTDVIDRLFQAMVSELSKFDANILAGVLHRFPDVMQDEFGPQVDELVNTQVEALTSNVQGNVAPLKEQRRVLVENFKATRAVLNQFGMDTSSVPDPKRGGSGRGAGSGTSSSAVQKTGKNKEGYRYYMNGVPRPKSQNTMSSLAYYATLGCVSINDPQFANLTEDKKQARIEQLKKHPERWSTERLKEVLAQDGIVWGPPGDGTDEWKIKLPNDTEIGARRLDPEKDKDIYDAVAAAASEDNTDDNDEDETPDEEIPVSGDPAVVS